MCIYICVCVYIYIRAKICNYSNVCFVNYERQASFFIMTVIILFGDNLVFTIQSTVSPFLLSLPNKTDSISNFLIKVNN